MKAVGWDKRGSGSASHLRWTYESPKAAVLATIARPARLERGLKVDRPTRWDALPRRRLSHPTRYSLLALRFVVLRNREGVSRKQRRNDSQRSLGVLLK